MWNRVGNNAWQTCCLTFLLFIPYISVQQSYPFYDWCLTWPRITSILAPVANLLKHIFLTWKAIILIVSFFFFFKQKTGLQLREDSCRKVYQTETVTSTVSSSLHYPMSGSCDLRRLRGSSRGRNSNVLAPDHRVNMTCRACAQAACVTHIKNICKSWLKSLIFLCVSVCACLWPFSVIWRIIL